MSAVILQTTEPVFANPLDVVEEMVLANEWAFERTNDDELVAEIAGRCCDYRLYFVWQPDLNALYFSSLYDMRVAQNKRPPLYELLALINEKLWVGHFDFCSEESMPMFRHTILLRGLAGASSEQVEDLVDIALSECERFYPAFQFVLWGGKAPKEAMAAAMLETMGEA